MSKLHEDVARLADAAAKLLHETARLRRDVATLHGRIEPFEGERPLPAVPPINRTRLRWPVKDALDMIASARSVIGMCERDLSAIRARIDNIEADAISREEMKPWIKR